MNIISNLRHKGKIAFLLGAMAFLELFNCNTFTNSISDMGVSFSEVYADRLMVQDYIYKLADKLHEQKLLLAESGNSTKGLDVIKEHPLSLSQLINDYEKTKLTHEEKAVFSRLKENIVSLEKLESKRFQADSLSKGEFLKQYEVVTNNALKELKHLSAIQLSCGKLLNEKSQKIVSFSVLLNQLDWALILVAAAIIQALIFTARSTLPKFPSHNLN